MLRDEDERGGEAPMEIDSPPPLWIKSPISPAVNGVSTGHLQSASMPLSLLPAPKPAASETCVGRMAEAGKLMSGGSADGHHGIETAPTVSSPSANVTPNRSPFWKSRTSPHSAVGGSGKSPLRSVHTNADAVVSLRRLATATFSNHSPPQRSPTMLLQLRPTGATPQSQKKRSSNRDPTKVAAAAALVSSSSTSWHLHLPIILMNYFQLIFNTCIGAGVLYLIFSATRTVLHDAQLKVDERLQAMMAEISLCARQYVDNRCSPELRVPAMERACMEWEACMARDPSTTSRSRLHAETIAEILNSFFGAISTKTYIFLISGSVLVIVLFNAAFYFGRHSQPGHQHQMDYASHHPALGSNLSSFRSSAPGSPLLLHAAGHK